MKSRQVPFFLHWRYENVQFWTNSIGHLGWLSRISNFPRFHINVNSLEPWKYISENSSPKGSFWSNKRKSEFSFLSCRILDIYGQGLLKTISNWFVLLSTWFRNLKPFFMNKNRCRTRQTHNRNIIKVGTHDGTSPCDLSLRLVASCELAIFASKSSRRDQLWSLRLVPRIQTSLNFWDKSLRLVLQNASCELFVRQVPVTSPFV